MDACFGKGPQKGNYFGHVFTDANHNLNDMVKHWDMRGEGKRTWKIVGSFLNEVKPTFFDVGNGLHTNPDGSSKADGAQSAVFTEIGARAYQSVTVGDNHKGVLDFWNMQTLVYIDSSGIEVEDPHSDDASEILDSPECRPANVSVNCSRHINQGSAFTNGDDKALYKEACNAKTQDECEICIDQMSISGQIKVTTLTRQSLFPGASLFLFVLSFVYFLPPISFLLFFLTLSCFTLSFVPVFY